MFTLFLTLAGCNLLSPPSAAGDWEGACHADGYEAEFELEIEADGDDLTGDARVTVSGFSQSGDLEGDFDGEEVDVDIAFVYSGYTTPGSFKGDLDEDTLEGKLMINASGDSITMDCELER